MIGEESTRVTTTVAVDPLTAFEVFTEETDLWWRRGPMYRGATGPSGKIQFEPGEGGRLVEIDDDGDEFEIGRILAWTPGERLVFEWRGREFGPDDLTEVEITFERVAAGTRVVLEHRGWEKVPGDHPARHGFEGGALGAMIGLWWAELLTALRRRVG